MEQEDNSELQIQEYLDGNLSEPELLAFEQRMRNDNQLAAEVRALQDIEHNLRGIGYRELKSNVVQWETEYQARAKKLQRYTWFAIAASLTIFILAGYFTLETKVDTNDLYTMYYSPYPDMILSRGESPKNEQQLTNGMQAYNNGSYATASNMLENYLAQNGTNKVAYLYLAICQLETNAFGDAESNLRIAAEDPNFTQQADWYRAMVYLKEGKIELAKSILNKIAGADSHYKREDAGALLEKL